MVRVAVDRGDVAWNAAWQERTRELGLRPGVSDQPLRVRTEDAGDRAQRRVDLLGAVAEEVVSGRHGGRGNEPAVEGGEAGDGAHCCGGGRRQAPDGHVGDVELPVEERDRVDVAVRIVGEEVAEPQGRRELARPVEGLRVAVLVRDGRAVLEPRRGDDLVPAEQDDVLDGRVRSRIHVRRPERVDREPDLAHDGISACDLGRARIPARDGALDVRVGVDLQDRARMAVGGQSCHLTVEPGQCRCDRRCAVDALPLRLVDDEHRVDRCGHGSPGQRRRVRAGVRERPRLARGQIDGCALLRPEHVGLHGARAVEAGHLDHVVPRRAVRDHRDGVVLGAAERRDAEDRQVRQREIREGLLLERVRLARQLQPVVVERLPVERLRPRTLVPEHLAVRPIDHHVEVDGHVAEPERDARARDARHRIRVVVDVAGARHVGEIEGRRRDRRQRTAGIVVRLERVTNRDRCRREPGDERCIGRVRLDRRLRRTEGGSGARVEREPVARADRQRERPREPAAGDRRVGGRGSGRRPGCEHRRAADVREPFGERRHDDGRVRRSDSTGRIGCELDLDGVAGRASVGGDRVDPRRLEIELLPAERALGEERGEQVGERQLVVGDQQKRLDELAHGVVVEGRFRDPEQDVGDGDVAEPGRADRAHQGLQRQSRPQLPDMVTQHSSGRAGGRAREQGRDRPERNRAQRDRTERRPLQIDRTERDRAQRDRAQRDRTERDRTERDRAQRRELDVDRAERDRAERDRAQRDRTERNRTERDRAQRDAAERRREDAVGLQARRVRAVHRWAGEPLAPVFEVRVPWLVCALVGDVDRTEWRRAETDRFGRQ